MKRIHYAVFCLVLSYWLPLDSAHAQWSMDPAENSPISTAAANQFSPAVVGDGLGGAIVTWIDYRSPGSHVYAQLIDSSGFVQWSVNGASLQSLVNGVTQYFPSIASDGAGGAIIAWEEDFESNYIAASRIDARGNIQWTKYIGPATYLKSPPSIISDDLGGGIIAWPVGSTGNADIYAQKINAAGAVQWTTNGAAICTAANNQQNLNLVSDSSGGAIITWGDYRNGTNFDIYAQRIDAAGAVQWSANGIVITTAAGGQYDPQIVGDGSGGAIIAWYDSLSGNFDIRAQRVSKSGALQWLSDGVPICTAPCNQLYPTMVSAGGGSAIIAWQDHRGGTLSSIYAQRVNSSGAVQWGSDGIAIAQAAKRQYSPAAVADGSGGAIITWEDHRNGSYDIYAQRINSLGTPQWLSNGVPISTAIGDQNYIGIVNTGSEGAIITWEDNRNGANSDIYAQNIHRNGNIGIEAQPTLTAVRDVPGDQGGKVTLGWSRSYLDAYPNRTILYYSIWRGVDFSPLSPVAKLLTEQGTAEHGLNLAGTTYRMVETAAGPTYWQRIDSLPSHYLRNYSFAAPTLADSGSTGTHMVKFFVSAETSDRFVFWDSNIDSGYSVDNLPPLAPANPTGAVIGNTVFLHWNPNSEIDLADYKVYRSAVPNFDPGTLTAYATTSDTMYTDTNVPQGNSYYALRAVDIHGNYSPKSSEVAIMLLGVEEEGTIPAEFTLLQNYPNPFNPSTTIKYELPTAAHVSLKVYDMLGRVVVTLVDEEQSGGHKSLMFDAAHLPSGIYLCRVTAGTFSDMKKLVLVK